jgi:hypothetical protein
MIARPRCESGLATTIKEAPRRRNHMSSDPYKMVTVEDVDGVSVTYWPNYPGGEQYTVLHPKCGVNIQPSSDKKTALRKAETHRRKCSGRRTYKDRKGNVVEC